MSLSETTESSSTTSICLWCNRVTRWGARPIEYDLCEGCAPRALDAVDMLNARRRLLRTIPAERPRLRAVR